MINICHDYEFSIMNFNFNLTMQQQSFHKLMRTITVKKPSKITFIVPSDRIGKDNHQM